jgi:general secretion pathway protein M
MTASMRDWFLGRTKREQRLILLMLAIALPLLAWLLVVRPVGAAYDVALQNHLAGVDRHGRVLALTEAARSVPARPVEASKADLQLVVTEAASQAGITLQGATANGANSVDVTVAGGRATALGQWLAQFEARGITVEQMTMTPLPDGTVNMSARLARRA